MLKMSPSGANSKDDLAVRLHAAYRGKVQTLPKCPLESMEDLAIWYTPGVAAASRAVAANRDLVYDLTNKGNTVAVLSDGSRVLGLGNIGPEAGLPVMEGKALLFKHFGGVDAVPICVAAHTETEIVDIAMALAPSFGGINLEDIATPKCFRILDRLRDTLPIPVWHDDQQGTAMVVLAGLLNALEVVGKRLTDVRIALIGIGAANMAVYRLLRAEGIKADQMIACDSAGALHARRSDIEGNRTELREKWRVCLETNLDCAPQTTPPSSRAHCSESSLPETSPQPLSVPALSRQCLVGSHEAQQHLQPGSTCPQGRSCTLLSACAWSLTHINSWADKLCYLSRTSDQQRAGHGGDSDAQAASRRDDCAAT
jgi:hypothetical protein